MSQDQKQQIQIPLIREILKDKDETEIVEAEENFREFLLSIRSICERMEYEQSQYCFDEIYSKKYNKDNL